MQADIRKVAVLGAGVMGSQIAAHLTNAGLDVLLFDLNRNLAEKGLAFARQIKPAAFYNPASASKIACCDYESDIERISEVDWVIEAIAERLDWKLDLYNKVLPHLPENAILSSNTSGIGIAKLTESMPKAVQERFLITHFFNPPRYLRLVEVIRGAQTGEAVYARLCKLLTDQLGKGIVVAKDTPNFIANRIGVYGLMKSFAATRKYKLSIEEVDKLTGTIIGRMKSATYRTADVVGLDTLAHVAKTSYENPADDEERELFALPDFLQSMLDNGQLGQKVKKGFYQKVDKEILSIDLETLAYGAQKKVRFDSYRVAKGYGTAGERIKAFVYHDDNAARFLWEVIISTCLYSLNRIPEIADHVYDIDNAMKWGYGWELGVFEIWDAIGVRQSVEKMGNENRPTPPLLKTLLDSGADSFYRIVDGQRQYFDFSSKTYQPVPVDERELDLFLVRKKSGVIDKNWCASIVDVGDEVGVLQFHSILQPEYNPIDASILEMLMMAPEIVKHYGLKGLIIGHQGQHFSAGANLQMILELIKAKQWSRIEEVARMLQQSVQQLRFAPFPVVMAPRGIAVGGGYEVQGAGDLRVVAAELYTGLVEAGVGLVPAGGGCLRLLLNNEERLATARPGTFPVARGAFETIAFAKVSTSAKEAVALGYLRKEDRIVINPAQQFHYAKQAVLALAEGYTPPEMRADIFLPGEGGRLVFEAQISDFQKQGVISEHDGLIGKHLAHILTGGSKAKLTQPLTEEDILELEREAFVELCKSEKTQARIQHMLKTGKPLRN
jgi:3-hydroxyacyl-CoA dehydrogenase